MLKQNLSQKQLQKLTPQQIQYMKLLQLNTTDFLERMEQELLDNPALEKAQELEEREKEQQDQYEFEGGDEKESSEDSYDFESDITDYLAYDDENSSYRSQDDYNGTEEERKEIPIAQEQTFHEFLSEQLNNNIYDERELVLARHLIGSLEEDGYLRRALKSIVNDLYFIENVQTTEEELEKVLTFIQEFEPPGIGARDLQECLLLQLKRHKETPEIKLAKEIVSNHMEAFTKKHYEKITRSLKVTEDDLRDAINIIRKLNPKPGHSTSSNMKEQYINPDFTVKLEEDNLIVLLNSKNAPDLKISRSYAETMKAYSTDTKNEKLKESVQFIKQKIDGAKWFIDSIKQRQNTLLSTMRVIVERQRDFFIDGDEGSLKPMIMKDVAETIGMDISTVSRVANSKYVETSFGIYPLKFFFTEGVANVDGEEVSNKEIKKFLKEVIEAEDKKKPLTDEKLKKMLEKQGYPIARRTVAKYREQMNIPVARLRKQF
jgi:RNA polymerase sigma-54 factor